MLCSPEDGWLCCAEQEENYISQGAIGLWWRGGGIDTRLPGKVQGSWRRCLAEEVPPVNKDPPVLRMRCACAVQTTTEPAENFRRRTADHQLYTAPAHYILT